MNERIRELVEKSGMTLKPRRPYCDDEPDVYMESDLDYLDNNLEATRVFFEGGLEKFAELIVQECARVCLSQRNPPNLNYKPSERFAEAVKQHFGVEE